MTNELSTTSILALFETNKQQREDFALRLIDAVEAGQADPLKVHLQVKCMEEIIKLITSNTRYRSDVLSAANKYGVKSFPLYDHNFQITEVGVKHDYSACNDPVFALLSQQLVSAAAALKEREAFLKGVPQAGVVITDPDTGETCTVYPPAKSSTTSVSVKLK